ncbi:MAG: CotH kinase family protein, partial [Verrucomicrobiales bacterium]
TVLRAAAFMDGLVPTDIDTQTYVFVDDVVEQDAAYTTGVAGLPASWDGQSPDYGLDPRVTDDPAHRQTIKDDLKSIPSLSIVMSSEDMFGSRGIYSHPGNRGAGWERATSLELIDPAAPDGSKDFQVDCAIRIQGGAFRSFGLSLKKSFRVLFKSDYGPSKLRYPFFGPDAAQEFDTLTFRMEANDGYQWGNRTNVQYARDEFGRRTQLAMGWPASHGRYMHIYINGVYWGVYNTIERPDAAFGETYFPGVDKAEWDGLNNGSSINEGNTGSWNTLRNMVSGISDVAAGDEAGRTAIYMESQGLNPDGSEDPAREDFINIDNYIDYLLVNFYMGNADWPHNNWYAGRARGPDSTGFHFFMWDAEWSLFLNSGSDRTGVDRGVCEPYSHLRKSLEFRMRWADRAHAALFNGGVLTPQPCVDRWVDATKDHSKFLVGELARWGDQHGTLRTMDQWLSANRQIRDDWMATRTPGFLNVLKGAGLYPEIDAPVFSQHGGSVSVDTPVTMATDADTIYYTLDGRDPRLLGGAPDPSAEVASFGGGGPVAMTFLSSGHEWDYLDDGSDQGTAWRGEGFDDSAWASGASPLGYGGDGEATTISYGPDPDNKFATTYYRTTVDIPDPSAFFNFLVRLRYDDAAAVYLNGVEIIRTSNLPAAAAFNEYASSTTPSESSWFDFTFPTDAFRPGMNTLAVEVHQGSGTSSDTRMDLVVRGEVSPGGGANISDPLIFDSPTVLTSRSYNSGSGEW